MKRKKLIALISSTLVLTGCTESVASGYVIYFGNQYISKDSFVYEEIDMKECQNDLDEDTGTYHSDIYILHDESQIEELRDDPYFLDGGEEISIPDGRFLVYFMVQIPEGYSPVRRENIQYVDETGREILVTDNFYRYASRDDLFYCFVDLVRDEDSLYSVFSFYYYVSDTYVDEMTVENIRVILASYQQETSAL